MTGQEGATPQTLPEPGKNGGFGSLFFEGLPTMTGIVTIVAQPFAQDSMKKMFALPDWLPALIALAAAGLLALYRMRIVRKSGLSECAICCPILVFIIFSAYVSGNNVVYYAKEGVSKAGVQNVTTGKVDEESLAKQNEEVRILRSQLENANEMIKKLAGVLNIPQSAPVPEKHSSLSSVFKLARLSWEDTAYAQNPQPERRETDRSETLDQQRLQQLQEELKKYQQTQQTLDKELKDLRQQQQKPPEQQQAPLIKSW
jgi:4-amino-4-deoxy-L-arabinose transferase-like glycosyltransferase